MKHAGFRGQQRLRLNPVFPQRQQFHPDAAGMVDPLDLFISRIFNGIKPPPT